MSAHLRQTRHRRATPPRSTGIELLPPELLLQVLSYLSFQTLVRASAVSTKWHQLCRDPYLWRHLWLTGCLSDGSHKKSALGHLEEVESEAQTINWYDRYKQRIRRDSNWKAGRFVNFQLPHREHPLEGHTGAVYAVQMQGNYLVSGSKDRTLRIWDLRTSRLVRKPLQGHQSQVFSLRFDPQKSQDLIVSDSNSAELVIWRFSTSAMVMRIPCVHSGGILSIRFNDNFIITSSADRTLKVWDRKALNLDNDCREGPWPKPLRVLHGHRGSVNSIDISGDVLVSASGDNTIKIWSISLGVCLKTLNEPRSVACVQLVGNMIVCGGRHGSVATYSYGTKSLQARLNGHHDLVRAVRARISGVFIDVIASGSYDGRVILWTRRGLGEWRARALKPAVETSGSWTFVAL